MPTKTKDRQNKAANIGGGAQSIQKSNEPIELTKQTKSDEQVIQIAANALVAEYNAIRAASLARDQVFSTVANFGVVLMVAMIASLPTVVAQQRYQLLLPLFSFLASSLALATLSQRWLLETLARYENDVLSPRLQFLFQKADKHNETQAKLGGYWQWQAYLRNSRKGGSFLYRFSRRISSIAPSILPLFASIGFILLFLYHRGLVDLTPPESILFYLSILYCLLTTLVYSVFIFNKRGSYT